MLLILFVILWAYINYWNWRTCFFAL